MAKKINDELRKQYVEKLMTVLKDAGEDVMKVASNKIGFPVVDSAGEDNAVVITVTVPTGSRDGELYDVYAEAENFEIESKVKAEKKAEAEAKKAKKIAKDKAMREAKAKAKAEHEAKEAKEAKVGE